MKKKKIISTFVVALVVVVVCFVSIQKSSSLTPMFSSDIEALSMCEVTFKGKVRLKCMGEGTCSASYGGAILVCDGTKID